MDGVKSISHVLQEDEECIRKSTGKSIWVSVKWALLYLLWNHGNKLTFKNDKRSINEVYFEWQYKIFKWVSKRSKLSHFDWVKWLAGEIGDANNGCSGFLNFVSKKRKDRADYGSGREQQQSMGFRWIVTGGEYVDNSEAVCFSRSVGLGIRTKEAEF